MILNLLSMDNKNAKYADLLFIDNKKNKDLWISAVLGKKDLWISAKRYIFAALNQKVTA